MNIDMAVFRFASLILALGIAAGGFLVGKGIQDAKRSDRYVSVRGLSERDVEADLATWTLNLKVAGDNLIFAQKQLDDQRAKLVNFLTQGGLTAEEIAGRGVQVVDREAQDYVSSSPVRVARYLLSMAVEVRSSKIKVLEELGRKTGELVQLGVAVAEEDRCSPGPRYQFTKLNAVKPEMIAEATKAAREAAGQFAKDSQSIVGKIRNASQGVFAISDRSQAIAAEGEQSYCAPSSIQKRVRVVTTVQYYLE